MKSMFYSSGKAGNAIIRRVWSPLLAPVYDVSIHTRFTRRKKVKGRQPKTTPKCRESYELIHGCKAFR